jgi:hypothetical protein
LPNNAVRFLVESRTVKLYSGKAKRGVTPKRRTRKVKESGCKKRKVFVPDLASIRDICAGHSAVVMGAGPSLRYVRADVPLHEIDGMMLPDVVDDDPLRKHVIIAVNDAIIKAPDADFYVTADGKMIYYKHWEILRKSDCYAALPSYSFTPKNVAKMGVSTRRAILFKRDKVVVNAKLSQFAKTFQTQSSGMAGVQLAVILGCSPIFIVGCEGECEDEKKYFWEFPNQPGPGGTKAGYKTIWQQVQVSRGNNVDPRQYDLAFDTRKGGVDSTMIAGWSEFSKANHNIDIVNATGHLRGASFKTCTVDEMLDTGTVQTPRSTGVEYWTKNYDIGRLRDASIGRSAVVMGSGPSLRHLRDRSGLVSCEYDHNKFLLPDIAQHDRVKSHVTIAVNEAILKVPDADYYITGDSRMPNCRHWSVVVFGSKCRILMPSFGASRVSYHRSGVRPDRLFLYRRRENSIDWKISRDSEFFLGEMNSMQAGVNLAVVLGCSPIYVLGCESRMEEDKKYFWEFDGEPGPGGTASGHKTIWQQTQDGHGRLENDKQYDAVFDLRAGKTKGTPAIQKWKRFANLNPHLDIRDACDSEWNKGYYRKVTVEEVLGCQTTR